MPPDPPAYRVHLPPPPSTNNLFVNIPGRGRVRSFRYKEWRSTAMLTMLAAGPRQRIEGPVHLVAEGPFRTDLDNVKAIPDLLVSMDVLGDDSQMRHFEVIWRPSESGLVTVSIWRME